jgi:ribosomal protein S16
VVAPKEEKLNGRVVQVLGHYMPTDKDKPFVFEKTVVSDWIAKGAQVSNAVAKLLNKHGFDLPVHLHPVRPAKKAPKPEEVVPVSAPVVATEEPASESVAEVAESTPEPAEEVSAEESEVPAAKSEVDEVEPVVEAPAEEA